eukprot:COSAG06_NODE_1424_length_9498_cov_12.066816_8_plen_180_part_00
MAHTPRLGRSLQAMTVDTSVEEQLPPCDTATQGNEYELKEIADKRAHKVVISVVSPANSVPISAGGGGGTGWLSERACLWSTSLVVVLVTTAGKMPSVLIENRNWKGHCTQTSPWQSQATNPELIRLPSIGNYDSLLVATFIHRPMEQHRERRHSDGGSNAGRRQRVARGPSCGGAPGL